MRGAQAKWLGGLTLFIDQPFPQFPENMGFWAEVLLPLYSLLSSPAWAAAGLGCVDQVLFGNLQRHQLKVRARGIKQVIEREQERWHENLKCRGVRVCPPPDS